MRSREYNRRATTVCATVAVLLTVLLSTSRTAGFQNIGSAFVAVYPDAVGTVVETVLSHTRHCGVCHYSFGGRGPRSFCGIWLADGATTPDTYRTNRRVQGLCATSRRTICLPSARAWWSRAREELG